VIARTASAVAPRTTPLTGRGAVLVMFGTCWVGCLIAGDLRWDAFAGAVFFMASGLAAYYARPGALLPVVVSPPAVMGLACLVAKAMTSTGVLTALSSTVVTLAGVTGWMFAGMALTAGIGLGRGLPGEMRDLAASFRSAREARDARLISEARGAGRRTSAP
jgi:hypothetical protein